MRKVISIFVMLLSVVLFLLLQNIELENVSDAKTKTTKHDEKYYQTKMCEQLGGDMEYVLFDKARVDCLTSEYAIEVDFAKKWAEGIGQALYYAEVTGKKPAVALIVEEDEDKKYIDRLDRVASKFGIRVILLKK